MSMACGPAGAGPFTAYSRVIIGCTAHLRVKIGSWSCRFTHTQETGTRAAGSGRDRQVHTVRLAGDSAYAGPPRRAVSVYRRSDGLAGTGANTGPSIGIPAAIRRPSADSVYRPDGWVRAPGSRPLPMCPGSLSLNGTGSRTIWLPVRDAEGMACANGRALVSTCIGPLCSG